MSASGAECADVPLSALTQATHAWRQVLAEDDVVTDTRAYNVDTSSMRAAIPLALRPRDLEQVRAVVRIAARFRVPLYPLSTGRNWGYGTSLPVRSPSVIVDLSGLCSIRAFDEELGVVTLEPGVTQGALSDYLVQHGLRYLVPTTGAGPGCSVLANALERGFGITPLTDHFAAVLSLKVVLADGSLYESFGRAYPDAGLAQAYRWGTGPYLDGLFAQSNLGLVVEASIALRPRSERCGAVLFALSGNREADALVPALREILSEAGSQVGAVHLMNRARVEGLLRGRQQVARQRGDAASRAEPPAGAWFGLVSLYGTREYFGATSRLLRRVLRGRAHQVRVFTTAQLERLRWLSAGAARLGIGRYTDLLQQLEGALSIVEGHPVDFALPLAYANSGRVTDTHDINPARDGCGLFWFAPIVPLRSGNVVRFVEFVERVCGEHELEAPITLTALSPRHSAATVALLFDRANPVAERRAAACLQRLVSEGMAQGFVPYRVGPSCMPHLLQDGTPHWQLVDRIKQALDPSAILAPGRYAPDCTR